MSVALVQLGAYVTAATEIQTDYFAYGRVCGVLVGPGRGTLGVC